MPLLIRGGNPLVGEVTLSGGKNAVLPILAATVMCRGICRIRECPKLSDVDAALEILTWLGADVTWEDRTVTVDPSGIDRWDIPRELMHKMRGSVFFIGPLMARFSSCRLSQPGGCPLGARPVDYHLQGLRRLGAEIEWNEELCCRGKMTGNTVMLPYPSVGATENLIMAAVGAEGSTTIFRCAREPEIVGLCVFLRKCGARIQGEGTSVIRVWHSELKGCNYRVIPDRMECATFMCAAAATGGDLHIKNGRLDHLERVAQVLQKAGCRIEPEREGIHIFARRLKAPGELATAPYPGFPTDAQAPMMAALALAEGISVIRECVFDCRMYHVPGLVAMGADINCNGNEAQIRGVERLRGAQLHIQDLRGGAALSIAALAAEGVSELSGQEILLRGYEDFAGKLRALGGQISIG